jgi:transposase
MALKKAQEREYARVLFVSENLPQKEIAQRVGVSENTISTWIQEGDWKKLKRSMLTTRHNQLILLYDQLDWMNLEISMRDIKMATSKEADSICKITSAIQKLEIETSIGEVYEVGRAFIDFMRPHDHALAVKVTGFFDLFIQTKMK